MQKIKPKSGQESVWDYPRPPRLELCSKHVRVVVDGADIANSSQAYRILETSHPPVYYIPPQDIKIENLIAVAGSSYCEWKGEANYYDLRLGERRIEKAAWSYLKPTRHFECIAGHVAFYPCKVDQCYVGDELVQPQEGNFYGGWITSNIVGPFKGSPGTLGW